MTKITKTLLRELSNSSSYTRGQSYYRSDSVLKLEKIRNEYIGKVRGSYPYTISIEITTTGNHYNCTCPYNFGGICKHIVAVGLAIIDGKYQAIGGVKAYSPKEIYHQIFCKLSEAEKEKFLTQLFKNNKDAKANMLKLAQKKEKKKKVTKTIQKITTAEVTEQILTTLSQFEMPVMQYDYDEEHYGDDSAFHQECEDIIDDMTASYEQDIKEKVKENKVIQALVIALGFYEAGCSKKYQSTIEDEYGRDFELDTAILEKARDYLTYIGIAITQVTYPLVTKTKKDLIDFWMEKCYDYQEANYAIIPAFYKFLDNLITDASIAAYTENAIIEAKLYGIKTVDILLFTANKQDKPALVKALLKDFALERSDLAQQLLALYWQEKEINDFIALSKLAFEKWPAHFADFLLDHITDKEDRDFYVKLLTYTTRRSSSIVGYQYLITFLTPNEKQALIASLKETISLSFYVQILAVEKQFDEVLTIVNQNFKNNNLFPVLIRPILNERPKACFELLTKKVRERVHNERGRDVYKKIVSYLQLAKKIPSFEKQLSAFINWLATDYKQLRALKDELKKANLL